MLIIVKYFTRSKIRNTCPKNVHSPAFIFISQGNLAQDLLRSSVTSLFAHYLIFVDKVRKSKNQMSQHNCRDQLVEISLSSLSHGFRVQKAVWRMDHLQQQQQPNFKEQAKGFGIELRLCLEVCALCPYFRNGYEKRLLLHSHNRFG